MDDFFEQWLYNSSAAWYEMHWTSEILMEEGNYFATRKNLSCETIKKTPKNNSAYWLINT